MDLIKEYVEKNFFIIDICLSWDLTKLAINEMA